MLQKKKNSNLLSWYCYYLILFYTKIALNVNYKKPKGEKERERETKKKI